MPKGHTFNSS